MSMIANNAEFGIVSDNEILANISRFSDEMLLDIIEKNCQNKFKPYQIYVGNLIGAIESNFKATSETFIPYGSEISFRRNEIYLKILEALCRSHSLSFNLDEGTDLYSLTYFLYDFVISNFTNNMITFFTNYIIRESNSLYEYLGLQDVKKNKDLSTAYSKKMFKGNSKLATIHANLDIVIDSICGFDIDMYSLIMTSINDRNIAALITNNISEVSNLFQTLFVPYIKDERYRPIITTLIRMALQNLEANTNNSIIY